MQVGSLSLNYYHSLLVSQSVSQSIQGLGSDHHLMKKKVPGSTVAEDSPLRSLGVAEFRQVMCKLT